MEEDSENPSLIEEDYYAFLNVAKEATNEEINNAYRRLSRLYHPDKHLDPENKKKADILFNKTKKAYEVLSDAHKRAIYDSVGVRGLETEGWQIIQRTRSPEEVRAEYERLARERAERRLQQRTNPKGTITVNVRASELFNKPDEHGMDYGEFDEGSGFPAVEISGMSFFQSVELPLTMRDTATLSGHLGTQNGTGGGNVNLSCRRLLSERGWIEIEGGAGSGPMLSLKGFRTLTRRMFCNGSTILQFTPQGIRPGIVGILAMQLDKHTVGYLTYKGGIQSSMTTSIVRDTENSSLNVTVLFGLPHSFITASYTKKMIDQELKLRLTVKAGTFGAIIEYGAEKKVSQHSNLSAAVAVGVPTGVVLKIKLTRANQTYSFPIHLCDEVLPSPIFYATITPLFVYSVVRKLFVEPYLRDQREREKAKQREVNRARMVEKKQEALAAVELMRATFARVRSEEESRRGLVIVKALYGRIVRGTTETEAASGDEENTNNDEVIDVTIPLQCLVKDSRLILHEASKSQLPGFYDPCVGEEKSLMVQYLHHTYLHEVSVTDTEPLRIPRQSHRVNAT